MENGSREELKVLIDAMLTLLEVISNNDLYKMDDFGDQGRLQMAEYAIYLAASDGKVSWKKTNVINECFDLALTPSGIRNIGIDAEFRTSFKERIPSVLLMLVAMDNVRFVTGSGLANTSLISETYLQLYKQIGQEILSIDGEVNEPGNREYKSYISMLEDYLDENLECYDLKALPIVDDDLGVSAPRKFGTDNAEASKKNSERPKSRKSGVTAPRKK